MYVSCMQYITYLLTCLLKPKFHLARHVSTRHDSKRSTYRAHAFWLCRACRVVLFDKLDTAKMHGLDTSNVSSRVVSRRDEPSGIWVLLRCGSCVKGFLTFLFSTVGLTFLLIGYSIVGGLVFMELEAGRENRTAEKMEKLRRDEERVEAEEMRKMDDEHTRKLRREYLLQLWELTTNLNVLHPDNWTTDADSILLNYTVVVYRYECAENT